MILLSYLNLVFKETYNNNQYSSIIKRRLCGFVGNFEKNDININDSMYEQILYYGVAILHRYTSRCVHSSRQKLKFEKRLSKKKIARGFFLLHFCKETPIWAYTDSGIPASKGGVGCLCFL